MVVGGGGGAGERRTCLAVVLAAARTEHRLGARLHRLFKRGRVFLPVCMRYAMASARKYRAPRFEHTTLHDAAVALQLPG